MSEYWIKEDNKIIYCDSDAGFDVPNHAMVVVSECVQQLIDAVQVVNDPLSYILVELLELIQEDEIVDCVALRSVINDAIDEWVDIGVITQEEGDDIFDTISTRYMIDQEIMTCAIGQHDDPRVIGVQRFNWVRVIGNSFDVRDLESNVRSRMIDFALDHPEYDHWFVEIRSSGLFVMEVPTADLDTRVSIMRHSRASAVLN